MRIRILIAATATAAMLLAHLPAQAHHRDGHGHGPPGATPPTTTPPTTTPPPTTVPPAIETRFRAVHTHGPFIPGPDEDELGDVEVWMYGAMLLRTDGTGVEGARLRFVSLATDGVYCDTEPTADSWSTEDPPEGTPPDEPGHGYCGFAAPELAQAQAEGGFAVVFDGGVIDGADYGGARCDVRFDPLTPGAVLLADGPVIC